MIVCVLGMHKSGTTLVAETLHHSGVHMADVPEELGYDESNKYERHATQALNRDVLAPVSIPTMRAWRRRNAGPSAAGYPDNNDSIAIVPPSRLRARLRDVPPDAARSLVAQLDHAHDHWGFKDPRTCLTYDLWRRVLPDHRIVAVYRPFHEVLTRYRVGWRSPAKLARVVHSYLLHNELLVDHLTARAGDHVVVRYDRVMGDDDELDRVGRYLDRDLVDRRKPTMYRARGSEADAPDDLPVGLPGPVRDRVRAVGRALDGLRSG